MGLKRGVFTKQVVCVSVLPLQNRSRVSLEQKRVLKIFGADWRTFLAIRPFTTRSYRARGDAVLGLVGVVLGEGVCFGGARSRRARTVPAT